tara:strand:+ start:801 stop:1094 length:294 start_codon:yes stop_codon:yes gene_type:complete
MTHKTEYNKRHKQPKDKSNSKADISKMSKIPLSILDQVVKRGEGAFKSNPSSVRPNITNATAWGYSRMYAFVNKMEKGSKLNHDTDLAEKISWYKKK